MSHLAFRMMMESGVLRPGDREIRRGPGGLPLHAMSQVPDFLNHSLDVLFGPDAETNQPKRPEAALRPRAGKPAPSKPASSGRSLKGLLRWLGLLDQTKGSSGPESPSPQLLVTRLEARVYNLEMLLKAERALCQTQREELSALRAQANRADVLEADLAIERESATRLVHWLQKVEQELASMRRAANDVGK